MDKEKQQRLFNDFPELFPPDKIGDIQNSGMYFGFQCGNGWYRLIYSLCASIKSHLDYEKTENDITIPIEVVQVKEKFGGLRFYFNGGNKKIERLIEAAESMSYHICEVCGEVEDVKQTSGWITTLCPEHFPKP